MKKNKLKIAILSLSLITVIAGAAVSPVLSNMREYYNINETMTQLIVALPSVFIILTNLIFPKLAQKFNTKVLAIFGLILYIIGGALGAVANSYALLLVFRAILGIGVGIIMPLSTGLIGYYFSDKEHAKLMGYSSVANNIGSIVCTGVSGSVLSINFKYAFLVYLLAVIPLLFTIFDLKGEKFANEKRKFSKEVATSGIPYYISAALIMILLYIFFNSFSFATANKDLFQDNMIGWIMSIQNASGIIAGLLVGWTTKKFKKYNKFIFAIVLILSYILLSINTIVPIIIGLFIFGLAIGTLLPIVNSDVLSTGSKDDSAQIMSSMSAFMFLGQFLTPFLISLFKLIVNNDSPIYNYYLGIVLGVVLFICLIFCKKKASSKN